MMRSFTSSLAPGLLGIFLAAPVAFAADIGPGYIPPGPPVLDDDLCHAVFHRHRHAEGRSLQRFGPERVPVIRHLRYGNGASLNSRVLSVTAGPNAEVALYKGNHFRRYMFTVAPGTVANLPGGVMDSYEIRCVVPAYAPAPNALPPGYK